MSRDPNFMSDGNENIVAVSVEEPRRTGPNPNSRQQQAKRQSPRRRPIPYKKLRPSTPDWFSDPAFMFLQAIGLAALSWWGLNVSGVLDDVSTYRVSIKSLEGSSPIDAAVNIARRDFPTADTVLLINADDFKDGTLASGLAGALQAPLLLSEAASISPRTLDVIREINPERVIIVGGEKLIGTNVEQELTDRIGVEVVRLSGNTGVETMVAVNTEIARLTAERYGTSTSRAVIVDPQDPFQSTASGAIAADWNQPAFVLIAEGGNIPAEASQLVSNYPIQKFFSLGPTFPNKDTEIASTLGEMATRKGKASRLGVPTVFLVPNGDSHLAMVAAPAAGKANGVVLPVDTPETISWLQDNCPNITHMTLLAPKNEYNQAYERAVDAATSCGAIAETPAAGIGLDGAGLFDQGPTTIQPTVTPSQNKVSIPASTVAPLAPGEQLEDSSAEDIQEALSPAAPEG